MEVGLHPHMEQVDQAEEDNHQTTQEEEGTQGTLLEGVELHLHHLWAGVGGGGEDGGSGPPPDPPPEPTGGSGVEPIRVIARGTKAIQWQAETVSPHILLMEDFLCCHPLPRLRITGSNACPLVSAFESRPRRSPQAAACCFHTHDAAPEPGRLMAHFYLSFKTVQAITQAPQRADQNALLWIIAGASELSCEKPSAPSLASTCNPAVRVLGRILTARMAPVRRS